MSYTNHSGGAGGSDYAWDKLGNKFGVTDNRHYWHNGLSKPPLGNVELNDDEIEEGWKRVLVANKTLKRRPEKYKSLLGRNWFQVKNAEAVFAIGTINDEKTIVNGGTGWAVQMAIDSEKPVYVFDQDIEKWFTWKKSMFIDCDEPTLTKNFAGIGTRKLNRAGLNAILEVYKKTFQTESNL